MNSIGYLCAIAFLAVFSSGTPVTASDHPFVGKWDCEVGTFIFTNKTYNNGSQTLRFSSVQFGAGNDVQLVFPDGYRISLMNVKQSTMTWVSPESGDAFNCRRVK